MKKISIKEPFFGAGSPKQFNWVKDGFDIKGVGVKKQDVKDHKFLIVTVENETYLLDCEDIKKFVNRYRSIYKAKNTELAVFSFSLLNNIYIE